ncbi:MAG: FxsA family protein [Sulfurovum sp.]|nr:FxsA family protein [Sulfurovum sp.]
MILAIIPLFFLELFISMKVGDIIGFFPSVIWILLTMMAGSMLLRLSPYTFMGNMKSVQMGKLDLKSANNASMAYLLGAVMLIIPGVITDLLAVFLLLYTLYLQLSAKMRPQQSNRYGNKYDKNKGDNDVIDVEVIDE